MRTLRNELKVCAAVLAIIVTAEFAFRATEERWSVDLAHLHRIEQLASSLDGGADLSIAIVGNSMVRHGIDPKIIRAAAGNASETVTLCTLYPDNSRINEWYYLCRNFLLTNQRKPDLMILCFGEDQLRDQPRQVPERIARYYGCGWDDLSDLARYDLKSPAHWCRFLLARCSSMYANRDRVGRRIFDATIPAYRQTINQLHSSSAPLASHSASCDSTYKQFFGLVDMARARNTRLAVIAMPTRKSYELDPQIVAAAHAGEFSLVDCRQFDGFAPSQMLDNLHLSKAGAARCSQAVVSRLPIRELLRQPEPAKRVAQETPRLAADHSLTLTDHNSQSW